MRDLGIEGFRNLGIRGFRDFGLGIADFGLGIEEMEFRYSTTSREQAVGTRCLYKLRS